MNPPTIDAFGCGRRKIVHPERRLAKRHMDTLIAMDRKRGCMLRLYVYFCEKCDGYHVGHRHPKK